MSKQSNQKYRKELEKKSLTTNSIDSGESMNSSKKEKVQNASDNGKAPSDCSNSINANHKFK